MILTAQNVMDMNDPFKVKEIKDFLQQEKITICALFETSVRLHNVAKVQKKFGNK